MMTSNLADNKDIFDGVELDAPSSGLKFKRGETVYYDITSEHRLRGIVIGYVTSSIVRVKFENYDSSCVIREDFLHR